MRLLGMVLLLVFAGMAGGAGENTDRPLLVGSASDFPPFAVGQTDKTVGGFTVELWQAVAKEAGLSYTIRVQPFHQILQEFKAGKIDVLINLAPSAERRRFADFTVPHVTVNGAIFVRKNESGIRSEADLAGKSIIVLNADLARDYAISRGWQKRLVQVNTVAEGFRLLASGQHDAMLVSKLVGMRTLQQLRISNIRVLDVKPGFSQKFSFAVQKGHTELLARINAGLALTKSSGVYDAIYEKWLGVYEEQEPSFKDMLKYLVPLAIGVMGFAAFFLYKRQSERRQAAEVLRIQQDRLHLILDSTAEAIYGMDLEGNCTFCNASCVNLLGYTHAEELLGKNMHRLIHHTQMDEARHPVGKCLIFHNFERGEGVHAGDEMLWRGDGSCFPAECWSHPQFQDGLIIGAVVTFIDITERKRAESRERAHKHVLGLLAKGAPLKEILQSITDSIELENPAMLCSILLLSSDGKYLHAGAASSLPASYNATLHGLEIGMGVGACGTAAFTGQRVIVEDIQTHPYCGPYKEIAARASLASCWSEPIKGASGKVLGTFAIYHHEVKAPTESEIQLIEQVAGLAGIAIDQSRANEERQLALLVYQNSGEAMMVTDADGAIITINPAFTELTGYTLDEVIGKNPHILSFGHQDEAFYQAMWHAINTTGYWQGEIWNRRKNGDVFAEWLTINSTFNADGSVHRRVALFSDITKKKESDELIWQQANFDPLTSLPNRHMFLNRLEQDIRKAHRANLPLALIFLDLDHFKEVNDTLGHDMGDILLRDAAQRLRSCVRDTDVVARLGGDEFTIIVGELADPGDVERVAQNILQKIAEPFLLGIETAYISASIGITFYPEDADSVKQLLRNADQAMYAAKSQGRNRYNYFTPSMQEAAQNRMRLANDLRIALARDEFRVYYQPIVELATGAIHKAEALIRWQHPTRGLISPGEFIHIAEETGLILDIGEWVFHAAATQVGHWRAMYDAEFQISVNKSPVQFHNAGNDHRSWIDYLQTLGLPRQSIVVEITESLLLDASAVVTDKLFEFRDAGMQVTLDDFGTGYSALAYLKKFDIDYLKIDQSFVHNLSPGSSDLALCEAIIVMAHKLDIAVIAEGVETAEERDLLIAAGCDYAQGYLFSRPVTVEEFEKLLC